MINAANDPDAAGNEIILLRALAWICGDDARAQRFVALTGLDADQLRARADDHATLSAVGRFLCDHEPDLIACAKSTGVAPALLAGAARAPVARA